MVEIFSFPILTVLTSYWGSLLSKCMHCFTSLVWEPRAHAVTSRKLRQKTQVHHVRDLCVSMEVALTVISADAPGCRDTTWLGRHPYVTQPKSRDRLCQDTLSVPARDSSHLEVPCSSIIERFVRSASHVYPEFWPIICSTSRTACSFRFHLVPHGLHVCPGNCVWTVCRQLCFNRLATSAADLKILLFKYLRAKLLPFRLKCLHWALLSPQLLSSWWTYKNKTFGELHVHPGSKSLASVSPLCCKQGSLGVLFWIYAWIWKIISGFLHGLL